MRPPPLQIMNLPATTCCTTKCCEHLPRVEPHVLAHLDRSRRAEVGEPEAHMLRHFFVTALIADGVNAKVVQSLAGHHSASFTLDRYADAVPEQLEGAGERVADVLRRASGSNLVAGPKPIDSK
jgi:hypothetical protein